MANKPVKFPGLYPEGSSPDEQFKDLYPGGTSPKKQGGDFYTNTPGTDTSILGGLISPGMVQETRPGRGGDGADALILRRLARAEGRIAKLESTQ
jgi:hypothetical protein